MAVWGQKYLLIYSLAVGLTGYNFEKSIHTPQYQPFLVRRLNLPLALVL